MFPTEHTDRCLQAWGKKLTHKEIGSGADAAGEPFKLLADQTESELDSEELWEHDMYQDHELGALVADLTDSTGPDQHALGRTLVCTSKEYVDETTNQPT